MRRLAKTPASSPISFWLAPPPGTGLGRDDLGGDASPSSAEKKASRKAAADANRLLRQRQKGADPAQVRLCYSSSPTLPLTLALPLPLTLAANPKGCRFGLRCAY